MMSFEDRPDIEALRRQAAELMARGPKNPTPTGPVRDAVGQPIGSASRVIQPDKEDSDATRPTAHPGTERILK